MTRFLCFPLFFVLVLPVFAQEESSTLPRDPAMLTRMKEQLSRDFQKRQQILTHVSPTDTELIEALNAEQAETAKQIREISQQLTSSLPLAIPSRTSMLPDGETLPRNPSPAGQQFLPNMAPQMRENTEPWAIPGQFSYPNRPEPVQPFPSVPTQGYNNYNPTPPFPVPNWSNQDRAWDDTPWGPRLPKELTEMKQSIESLQKEIGELKDTIKALETQIQLLSRMMLNDRVKENGN